MRISITAVLVAATFVLTGCYDNLSRGNYLRRSDTITLGAGDAVAFNKAVQTIDPWPWHARNDRIDMDGSRALLAARRYKEDKVKKPQTLDTAGPVAPSGGAGAGGDTGGGAQ
jgi:hypothetical protein